MDSQLRLYEHNITISMFYEFASERLHWFFIVKKRFKFPVWAKTLIVLVLSVLSMSVTAVLYSSYKLKSTTQEHYINKSIELADTLAIYLNFDDVREIKNQVDAIYQNIPEEEKVSNEEWDSPSREAYLSYFTPILSSPEYERLMDQIVEFHSRNDAKWTYLGYADFVNNRLIYLVDDAIEEERCLPGSFDDFTEQDMTVEANIDEGFKPEITNKPEYGYLVSTGRPIYDNEHHVVAFALVDISMDAIVLEQNRGTQTLTLILLGMGFGIITIGYLLVLFLIIRPIRILTKTANEYTKESTNSLHKFSEVNIITHDEIRDLANSMKKMEEDLNHYISDLFNATTKLEGAEKKADELKYIADRDALTGLMNKRAYFEKEESLNEEIRKGKATFGVVMIDLNDLKVANDSLGHEKGDNLIVSISNIIKEVFKDSPCYRVGGDEFVIIVEEEDYHNLVNLEKAFVKKIEESQKEDVSVSAAIGSAKFNTSLGDNNVEDVFKRADKAMYENKKKMKEESNN